MAVILATSRQSTAVDRFDAWCAVSPATTALDPERAVAGLEGLLERAYDDAADAWWRLARELGTDQSAILAHAPSAAGNVSDFGLMLAWERLVDGWARSIERVLVVCDDPWAYRHFATLPGVVCAGARPGLAGIALCLAFRGVAARVKVALSVLWAATTCRRPVVPKRNAWLLVYAHPGSGRDGDDAYFGSLMREAASLRRVVHVDGGWRRVRALAGLRTVSLHAWGRLSVAFALPFLRWKPGRRVRNGPRGWLVRRAAAIEGGSGQAAMIAWQVHCQARWLADARPSVVAWPWENHAWERAFVRAARRIGTRTVGYQHASVAWREWNYSPRANPDGLESVPDRIFCTGEPYRRRLLDWGLPERRATVAGAWRYPAAARVGHDPAAPVFVALPSDPDIAAQMIGAIGPLAAAGGRFLVRDHPMSPFVFSETPGIARADGPLATQQAVSAVVYCMTSVGLEAALAGLPTLRFRPRHRIAADPMPPGLNVPAASAADLGAALRDLTSPAPVAFDAVFAPPDADLWRDALAPPPDAEKTPAPSALGRRWAKFWRDPVLRRWLFERMIGRVSRSASFVPHRPPYLPDRFFDPIAWGPASRGKWRAIPTAIPTAPFAFRLHGRGFCFESGRAIDVYHAHNIDLETYLGIHRFSWLAWTDADPAWVDVLWRAWRKDFGNPTDDWPWHPYTTTERALNILDFAERSGMPGPIDDTLEILAAHGNAIAARLEYFGDRETGNHLANNGRGLYRIGLALGIESFADAGGRILIEEAKRIFLPSGMLREGSSHYHALIAGWYVDCLDAARSQGRPEADDLALIADRAVGAAQGLILPGGMPLIGDVSPDCPPEVSCRRLQGRTAPPSDPAALSADGWTRAAFGPWAGLWHMSPDGWSAYPGHGHQDVGAFELHFNRMRVFVDPGRGAYGETGDAARYRSSAVHSGLIVDSADPYPENRPYYDNAFRRRIAGPAPTMEIDLESVAISFLGYSRMGGIKTAARRWRFAGNRVTIEDVIVGRGRRSIVRRLVTPMAARIDGDQVFLEGEGFSGVVRAEVRPTLEPIVLWYAYGEGRPGTAIVFAAEAALPWEGRIEIVADGA